MRSIDLSEAGKNVKSEGHWGRRVVEFVEGTDSTMMSLPSFWHLTRVQ